MIDRTDTFRRGNFLTIARARNEPSRAGGKGLYSFTKRSLINQTKGGTATAVPPFVMPFSIVTNH